MSPSPVNDEKIVGVSDLLVFDGIADGASEGHEDCIRDGTVEGDCAAIWMLLGDTDVVDSDVSPLLLYKKSSSTDPEWTQ
jgi:hypothetical protein